MAEHLRTWSYGGPKFDDQPPNGCLTAVCNSSFKGPDTLLYPPQVLNLHADTHTHAHRHVCTRAHTHTKILINKLQINWNYVNGQTKHQIMARIPSWFNRLLRNMFITAVWYIIKPCLPQKVGHTNMSDFPLIYFLTLWMFVLNSIMQGKQKLQAPSLRLQCQECSRSEHPHFLYYPHIAGNKPSLQLLECEDSKRTQFQG